MKHVFFVISFLTLLTVLVSCGREGAVKLYQKPSISLEAFESNPVGEWEYVYLSDSRQYQMVVLDETLQLNGNTYFKVEPTERDTSLRAIRIHSDGEGKKIDWLIAGDPSNPDALAVEANSILKTEDTELTLSNGEGQEFAKLTKKQ